MKLSKLGTQFFAHKRIGDCATAPETEAHLRLKRMAVEVARSHGWDARTEVVGAGADGERWTADVLATKGGQSVAVEIQWSRQTNEETIRRQARYKNSGVRTLWLLRHSGFPLSEELPAAQIGGTPDEGFFALIPTAGETQTLPMQQFLEAVFSKRFRFGLPLGCIARVSARAGHLYCWSCGAETRILTGVEVDVGPYKHTSSVPDLDSHPAILRTILEKLGRNHGIGEIKRRYSGTQQRRYLSNGCSHCDALIGELYEHDAWEDQQVVCDFHVAVDGMWSALLRAGEDGQSTWGVYRFS